MEKKIVEKDKLDRFMEYANNEDEDLLEEDEDFLEEDEREEEEEEEDDIEDEEDEEEEDEGHDDEDQHEGERLLDLMENNHQFERLEYEALAEKKRKTLSDTIGGESTKRARLDDMSGATFDEIMEVMNYGLRRRRKSRKAKKKGRRKGSKNKVSPEITRKLGDATLHYVHGHYEEAISCLNEVVKIAPHVAESYHTLGLVHEKLGNTEKAMGFYTIAARLMPKDSSLWKLLFSWHKGRGDIARARMCLSKAIRADPNDIDLRYIHASLYEYLGDYQRAAESCEQIVRICPEDVEALKMAAKLYLKCGQIERVVTIIEDYLKNHPSEADIGAIILLVDVLIESNVHMKALQHIEHAQLVYCSGKELPLLLKVKAGICYVHLQDIGKAETLFSTLQQEHIRDHAELVIEVADAFTSLEHFDLALKYYHMLESNVSVDKVGSLYLKIAECYLSLKERVKAIDFYYKALPTLDDSVDARLALVSLLVEDSKDDEAISILSPPENSIDFTSDKQKPWWLDGKIKLKLSYMYRSKGMLEDFVNTILPLVRESLYIKTLRQKVKKRLTTSVLRKRTKILDVQAANDVFGGIRPLASRSDLLKASRARKLLQKKEEQRAAAKAAGIDWLSEDSDDESPQEIKVPPLPNFLKNAEHHDLIIDLCKALESLKRYWEALEIMSLTRRLASDKLPDEKKAQLESLAAKMSYSTTDPKYGFDYVKTIVLRHPYSIAAWNCYYKITSRLGKIYSRHPKFLRHMRMKHSTCVSPILISAHQFNIASFHQDAAREYLEAYKLLPESPLVNLCVGTALINLTLGFRLQNKHQCLAQGLAFLYNNLRLTENSQEAMYNIARAYHHIGLVTLAASYYEKVLSICEKDYPVPKLLNENSDLSEDMKPGYCDLRREAAYNLHLIYKQRGAIDLARQVLKDHCTV